MNVFRGYDQTASISLKGRALLGIPDLLGVYTNVVLFWNAHRCYCRGDTPIRMSEGLIGKVADGLSRARRIPEGHEPIEPIKEVLRKELTRKILAQGRVMVMVCGGAVQDAKRHAGDGIG